MKITIQHLAASYVADSAAGTSIAIPLQFDGAQPNHFGANKASQEPLRLGGFVGKTELGGSCNVDTLQIVPHCNGTHTETISHIVNDDIWIGHAAMDVCCIAVLVSVPVVAASRTSEDYRPKLNNEDTLITAASLKASLRPFAELKPAALVIRTLPNTTAKKSQSYSAESSPAFLTVDAMKVINELGCRHLLLDLPSVDRMYDDGLLTNHHIFWNVPENSHAMTADSWQDKTITEMAFIDDALADGIYLLNLQVPSFSGDAAPSRPILLPLQKTDG